MKFINGKKYFTVGEAAQYLGISTSTMRYWVDYGLPNKIVSFIQENEMQFPILLKNYKPDTNEKRLVSFVRGPADRRLIDESVIDELKKLLLDKLTGEKEVVQV